MIYRTAILILVIGIGSSHPKPATASEHIEAAGDVIQILIPAIAYGTTFYLGDSEGRTQFYKSFFTNLAVTHGLKHALDRERPNGGGLSFPSGHTSVAFQGAAFIHRRYGWEYGIPAYIGASFVGYSRVESDNHHIEDVLAGAAIGAISSFLFTQPYRGITVHPVASSGYYGISLSRRW